MNKILIVLTNTPTYGFYNEPTGLWMSELTRFINSFDKKEYDFDFISPDGGYVPIDPRSMKYIKDEDVILYRSEEFRERAFKETKKPSEINPEEYEAIYFAGGHGTMWDFPKNEQLNNIALTIYRNNGYILSVGHGIAGLLFMKDENGKYIVKDKNITGFTTCEEFISGKRKKVPFLNSKIAKANGTKWNQKLPMKSNVVVDGNIITGQNPMSVKRLAEEYLLLKKVR